MRTNPIFHDGDDTFLWCVDERGVIRAVSVLAFKDLDADAALASWGWRFATANEVTEFERSLPALRA